MAGASLKYRKAFQAIHHVLIYEWDPIGVSDEPMAQDEYDSYIPTIFRLLTEGADDYKMAQHLEQIETVSMGLSSGGEHNRTIAKRLREAVDGV
jgi:hypothetical protein